MPLLWPAFQFLILSASLCHDLRMQLMQRLSKYWIHISINAPAIILYGYAYSVPKACFMLQSTKLLVLSNSDSTGTQHR